MEDRNDPPDKKSDIEDDKSIDSKENLNIRNDENQIQMRPTITDIQTFKDLFIIIDSRFIVFIQR